MIDAPNENENFTDLVRENVNLDPKKHFKKLVPEKSEAALLDEIVDTIWNPEYKEDWVYCENDVIVERSRSGSGKRFLYIIYGLRIISIRTLIHFCFFLCVCVFLSQRYELQKNLRMLFGTKLRDTHFQEVRMGRCFRGTKKVSTTISPQAIWDSSVSMFQEETQLDRYTKQR